METKLSADNLSDRMKGYESTLRLALPWRLPVIIRVDGKAFHTFTRGMERPFDAGLVAAMDEVAIALCEEVQCAVLAYAQSDEISILLHGYRTLNTQPWFGNDLQKMVSISAAVASATMSLRYGVPVHFDSRAFILPEAEIVNYFIWRQQDASRNSVSMLARSMFSHKELHGKSTKDMHEMLHTRGVNWNDLPTRNKRGSCAVKETYEKDGAERHRWISDHEIPVFTQDREYIEARFRG